MSYFSRLTKGLLAAVALWLSAPAFAQHTIQIVTGPDHDKQVYFSLDSGIVKTISADDWDVSFNYSSDAAYTISINEGKGMKCWMNKLKDNAVPSGQRYNYQYDPTTTDTSGMASELLGWTRVHNSVADIKLGAFNRITGTPPKGLVDYGHSYYCLAECTPGTNNTYMHGIHGYRNFVIQLEDGSYRQVVPVISAGQTGQQFFVSDMNGTNKVSFTWTRANWENAGGYNAGGQMYFKFGSNGPRILDSNFAAKRKSYDLIFTDYFNDADTNVNKFIPGVLSKDSIAQVDGRTLCNISFDSVTYETKNNSIGDDWKTTAANGNSSMVRGRYYIVKALSGTKYLVWFTKYDSRTGTYELRYMTQAEYAARNFTPEVAFTQDTAQICPGRSVHFTNQSADADSLLWTFQGGTPATSTAANPVVSYAMPGSYAVSLRGRSCNGAFVTKTVSQLIDVAAAPVSNFGFTTNATTVQYQNQSLNATAYSWDFGDGAQSSDPAPTHTYANDGTYNVQLVALNGCDRHTSSRTVTVASRTNSVVETGIAAFGLYPNPSQGLITLEGNFGSSDVATIYDATGKSVYRQHLSGKKVVIDLQQLHKGIYQLIVSDGNSRGAKRFVIN